MDQEISTLEEYRTLEEEFKALLSGFGSMGDLVDQDSAAPKAKEAMEKMSAIKEKLAAYRTAHPEEFINQN